MVLIILNDWGSACALLGNNGTWQGTSGFCDPLPFLETGKCATYVQLFVQHGACHEINTLRQTRMNQVSGTSWKTRRRNLCGLKLGRKQMQKEYGRPASPDSRSLEWRRRDARGQITQHSCKRTCSALLEAQREATVLILSSVDVVLKIACFEKNVALVFLFISSVSRQKPASKRVTVCIMKLLQLFSHLLLLSLCYVQPFEWGVLKSRKCTHAFAPYLIPSNTGNA